MFKRILVPTDGSEITAKAIGIAKTAKSTAAISFAHRISPDAPRMQAATWIASSTARTDVRSSRPRSSSTTRRRDRGTLTGGRLSVFRSEDGAGRWRDMEGARR